MLGALGLLLSVHISQLENFAGTMNFVIFPMFFVSSALYPLARLHDSSLAIWWLARLNPFTHAVELIRFALYGRLAPTAALVVIACGAVCFLFAVQGYDPQRGLIRRAPRGA
jgi:ABC-2 type transport system permease protein